MVYRIVFVVRERPTTSDEDIVGNAAPYPHKKHTR
jgi:hypothetical protein